MFNSILIKSYTKLDFHSWVVRRENNGLNDSIISKNRAIAQMNNPDANDDDILLTIAQINEKCIGYRGVFPENIIYEGEKLKIGWLTTFFVDPSYRGKGMAKKLMEPIINYYNNGVGSIHSSENALKVYKNLGWDISLVSKTTFLFKLHKPNNFSIKKRIVNFFRPILNFTIVFFHNLWLRKSYKQEFEVEYTDIIDNQLYHFIRNNARMDLFLKSQEKLNWILRYKWPSVAPCIFRTNQKYYFTNYVKDFSQYALIIKVNEEIVGFLILRNKNGHLTIPFFYYADEKKECVFKSILEHMLELKTYTLTTSNKNFIQYIDNSKLIRFAKQKIKISYSHTKQAFFKAKTCKLQDGDGDLFF